MFSLWGREREREQALHKPAELSQLLCCFLFLSFQTVNIREQGLNTEGRRGIRALEKAGTASVQRHQMLKALDLTYSP